MSRQTVSKGVFPKCPVSADRISSLRRKYACSDSVASASSGIATVRLSRSSSRRANTFTS